MSTDPVLQWAGEARQAGRAHNVAPELLLALISVESGGREGLTSSAGAGGLTQFIPGTARQYGVDVRPGHARSQIDGAARYLADLGVHDNPERALASYNAGPGNWRAGLGYAKEVLARVGNYRGAGGPAAATPAVDAPPVADQGDGGGLFAGLGQGALHALVWIVAVITGLAVTAVGVKRAAGGPA